MKYDQNNVFAKIIRGDIPCKKVYEDEKVLAFYDINPKATLHILVVPKGFYMNFEDFCENAKSEEISYFFKKVNDIASEISNEIGGFRLVTNNKQAGGQEVFHFHVHILAGNKLSPL